MSNVKARLDKGDFMVAGEVDERLPSVTDGLVAHFPFDGDDKGMVKSYNPVRNVVTQGRTFYKLELLSAWGAGWHGLNEIEGYVNKVKQTLTGLKCSSATYIGYDYEDGIDIGSTGTSYGGDNAFDGSFCTSDTTPASGVQWLTPNNSTDGSDIGNNYYTYNPFPKPEWITFSSEQPLEEIWVYNGRYGDNRSDGTQFKDFNLYVSYNGIDWALLSSGTMNQGGWLNGEQNKVKIFINPSSSVNTTLTYDGIAVEEATTNYEPDPINFSGYDFAWATESVVEFQGRKCLKIEVDCPPNQANWTGSYYGISGVALGGGLLDDWFTRSCWMYVEENGTFAGGMPMIHTGHNGLKNYTHGYYDTTNCGTWQHIQGNAQIADTTLNTNIYFYLFSKSANSPVHVKFTCYIYHPQLEKKRFATSFVEDSKSAKGIASYDRKLVDPSNFTINTWVKHSTLPQNIILPSSGRVPIFEISSGIVATNRLVFGFRNTDNILDLWISNTDSANNTGIVTTYKAVAHTWTMYTLSFTGGTYKIYVNGELIMTHNAIQFTTLDTATLDIGGDHHGTLNGVISDFSIYNRALSDEEVRKLANPSFQLTQYGSVINSKVVEKPNDIPTDAKYFPYGDNAMDEQKVIKPLNEVATTYENGSAWLGVGTTNLYGDTSTLAVIDGNGTLTEQYYGEGNNDSIYKVIKTLGTPTSHASYRKCVGCSSSTQYTVSWKLKVLKGSITNIGTHFLGGNTASVNHYELGDGWYQFYYTGTTGSTTTTLCVGVGFIGNVEGEYLITEPQLEQKSFHTPFVNGTRAYTNLNYTGTDLTPNSWQEFTILYWINYSVISGWQLSGAWSRFYIGHYGGDYLRFSWVESGTQRSVGTASGLGLQPNKWYMLGFSVKNNTFIDIYLDGVRLTNWEGAFQLNHTAMDFEWNSIQPNTSSYPLNAYIRDAMFIPRVLNPTEITSIYQTQMRGDSSLQIQGLLREGQNLV